MVLGFCFKNELVGFCFCAIKGQGLATTINSNISGSYYSGYHDSTCSWSRTNTAYVVLLPQMLDVCFNSRQASGIAAAATGSVFTCIISVNAASNWHILYCFALIQILMRQVMAA